ncbi:hypothetical protein DZK34_02880 [Chlamydia abortus]|uniref:hypothetical protein n=1 Tax=Chlamydia abortus TaxID=83555 RepID=UPI0011EE58BF|nr:hypothetical protein [Chlamydia abortus]QEM73902.1 hypothetical protein DZK34_02880 [Chlamydia abortus]
MINLSRLCSCPNLTKNSETSQGVCQSKSLKVSLAVLAIAIPIILMVVGGLGLAGSASSGLLIFGGISLAVLGLILAISCSRSRQSVPMSEEVPTSEELPTSEEVPASEEVGFIPWEAGERGARPRPALTAEGRVALNNVMEKLNQERDALPLYDWEGLRHPINSDISRLLILKARKNNEVLELLHVDQNGRVVFPDDEAASNPVLVNAVTELMELSFAVSIATLRDLEAYRERNLEVTSNLESLARQNSAYYLTFYHMSSSYILMRHLQIYSQNSVPSEEVARRQARFYQEGTPEFRWRSLYNCFCEQARWYIGDEQAAAQRENRLIKHTTADTSREDFGYPGTIPT